MEFPGHKDKKISICFKKFFVSTLLQNIVF